MRDATFSSKAYGTRENKEITIEGRFQFDMMKAIMRDHKLSSYSPQMRPHTVAPPRIAP